MTINGEVFQRVNGGMARPQLTELMSINDN